MSDVVYAAILAQTGDEALARRISDLAGENKSQARPDDPMVMNMELTIANHLRSLITMYAKYGRRTVEEVGSAGENGVIVNVMTGGGQYLYTLTLSITP